MTTTKNRKPVRSSEDRDAAVKAAFEKVATAVAEIRSSDDWKRYLATAARFHKYSFNNVMLMTIQAEERGMAPVTRVAGFKAWLEHGRHVRKGEKGLQIFAPIIVKREDEDGNVGRKLIGYRLTTVFDIQQTEGDEIADRPTFDQPTGKAPTGLIPALIDFAAEKGYSVSFGSTGREGVEGYTDPRTKSIVISTDLANDAARASVLAHEVAHSMLHCDGDPVEAGWEYVAHRGTAETEAEGVSFVVAEFYGLEVGNSSAGYIAGWAPEAETILKVGARITATAKAIIDGTVEGVTA